MSINIPDSLPKLFILLGIIGFAFGIYVDKELSEQYSDRFDKYDVIQDSVHLRRIMVNIKKEELLKRSESLSEMYDVDNPVTEVDSVITFTQTFSGEKNKVRITDSLNPYWNNYVQEKASLKILSLRKEIELENLNEKEKVLDSKRDHYGVFIGIGFILFIIGVSSWIGDNSSRKPEIPIKQKDKIYRYCQSCGHNFTSMRPYGTEKDKSEHNAFCKGCYKKGKFTNSKLTKEEFINQKKLEIKKKSWWKKKILMVRFNNLERWNKDHYF